MSIDLSAIPVVDTHEHVHFGFRGDRSDAGLVQVLFGNHYLLASIFSADPANAGGSWDAAGSLYQRLTSSNTSLDSSERESIFRFCMDQLPKVQMTSDWRCLQLALRDLYGLEGDLVTPGSFRTLEERISARYREREAWSLEIMDRANIKILFWCYGPPLLPRSCRGVLCLADFLDRSRQNVTRHEELAGGFSDWLEAEIARYGPVALKTKSAYTRDLGFRARSPQEVDRALPEMGPEQALGSSVVVSDYLHDLAARSGAESGLPMQIHTGCLAGNRFSHPMTETYANQLEPFISRHPRTKFDLFHGSFPQWGEALILARRYPNVHLNMCWVPTISESASESMLRCALEACPANKIMWGGDAHSLEMAYGSLALFRGVLGRVLADSHLSPSARHRVAEWVLWRSAAELYGLDPPL